VKDHILLTGATGFVGWQVAKALGRDQRKIHAVARPGSVARVDELPGIARVTETGDMFAQSFEWWESVCKDCGTVIHCAWFAEPGVYQQSPRNLDCLTGTIALAKGAAAAGVKRFVGIGSCAEYRMSDQTITPATPLDPPTPYAACKAAAYLALNATLKQSGVSFLWCRLFYLFGEGEDQRRLVPYIHQKLGAGEPAHLTSGTQVRDFLDVAEAGEKIARATFSSLEGAENICSGEGVTVRALAESIADHYGRRDLLRFGARADNVFDPPRIVGKSRLS